MWIRSQDKTKLIKIDSVIYGQFNCAHSIRTYIDNSDVILGIYKSKERCIEIINEIQEMIRSISVGQVTMVFEMPKE
jgi:hypothetical protein